MKKLPDDFLQELKNKNPIEDLLRKDGHQLEATGVGFKCLSPFHPESDPSFHIDTEHQRWSDFSIGEKANGDSISYVMKRDSKSFMEAITWLCQRAEIAPPHLNKEEYDAYQKYETERKVVEGYLTLISEHCHDALPEKIRIQLRSHYGLSDDILNDAKIGWVDSSLYDYVTNDIKLTRKQVLQTGMFYPCEPFIVTVIQNDGTKKDVHCDYKCMFENRITFPYLKRGSVVYMAARVLPGVEDPAKYKKLSRYSDTGKRPKKYVSKTISNEHFYYEDTVKPHKPLLVTEGLTDVLSALDAGYEHVTSPVTTSFREKDAEKLLSFCKSASKVIIVNDSEENKSGEKGALKTAEKLHEGGIQALLGDLPRPKGVKKVDVNSYIKDNGAAAFKSVVDGAITYIQYLINSVEGNIPPAEMSRTLKPVIKSLAFVDEIESDSWKQLITSKFGISKRSLNNQVKTVVAETLKLSKTSKSKEDANGIECLTPTIELNFRHMNDVFYDTAMHLQLCNNRRIQKYTEEQNTSRISKDKDVLGNTGLNQKDKKHGRIFKRRRQHRFAYSPNSIKFRGRMCSQNQNRRRSG